MKPMISLYAYNKQNPEASPPSIVARNLCREVLMSSIRSFHLRPEHTLRVVVKRPFEDRVVAVNKILRAYHEDSEEVSVSPSKDVILPRWVSSAPPLLHAVLGFLRNPIPAHRVQLMATCTILREYDYRLEFNRFNGLLYNGCQTFCLLANPGVWTSEVLNYLKTLRKPWSTLERLDPYFRSIVLYNEGVIDIEDVLQRLTRKYNSPKPLRLHVLPGDFGLRSFARVTRLTADGESTHLSSMVLAPHPVAINEAFGRQHVFLMCKDLIRHATYPITDGV